MLLAVEEAAVVGGEAGVGVVVAVLVSGAEEQVPGAPAAPGLPGLLNQRNKSKISRLCLPVPLLLNFCKICRRSPAEGRSFTKREGQQHQYPHPGHSRDVLLRGESFQG